MASCPFCKIISGDLPGTIVYQDEICTGLMDIQPINPGHMLVIPNEHLEDLGSLPEEILQHLFLVAQRLAKALRLSGIQCEGVNLFIADGEVAFQHIPHFHIHIIPRFQDDGFGLQLSPRYAELPTIDELEKNAFYIKQVLD